MSLVDIRALIGSILFVAMSICACSDQSPTGSNSNDDDVAQNDLANASISVAQPRISESKQNELLQRSNAGDWKAAKELGLFRMYELLLRDKTTLSLVRTWAKHECEGLFQVYRLLEQSCKQSERADGIIALKLHMKCPEFLLKPLWHRRSVDEYLLLSIQNIDRQASDCIVY